MREGGEREVRGKEREREIEIERGGEGEKKEGRERTIGRIREEKRE